MPPNEWLGGSFYTITMRKLLISILLLITAVLLLVILILPSTCLVFFIGIFLYKKKSILHYYGVFIKDLAYSLDQFGNVLCQELFNVTLINIKSEHLFGNPDETISSVLGKNELKHTLTKLGKLIVWILNKIDFNHTKNAIEEDEN